MDYPLNAFHAAIVFGGIGLAYVISTILLMPSIAKEKAKRNARKG